MSEKEKKRNLNTLDGGRGGFGQTEGVERRRES